jgi:predicted glycogen debranching enzyme
MTLPSIAFTKNALSNFSDNISKEWIISNGIGGYASSTILGINTRKYHGLLVAALHPPADRTVCLSKLDEDINIGNITYRLGSTEFKNIFFPEGYKFISKFSVSPFPEYFYEMPNIRVQKTIILPKNKNAVEVYYKITNNTTSSAGIKLFPLLTCRHFHDVVNKSKEPLKYVKQINANNCIVSFSDPRATIFIKSTDAQFKEAYNAVDGILYREESTRGESDLDDCFQPGYFELVVPSKSDKECVFSAAVDPEPLIAKEIISSLGDSSGRSVNTFREATDEKDRLLASFYDLRAQILTQDWLSWILIAADSFVVRSVEGKKSIIAGYHWFESWGRDSFISLPGLLLVTGRFEEAKDVLLRAKNYCKDGLIPNYVEDRTGKASYNTVDATLWFVNAVLQYLKYTADFETVEKELWDVLQEIVENHCRGTLFGIRLDKDGLLTHGAGLTWMDAKIGVREITPRQGKAVEIQALWYNALRAMAIMAKRFGMPERLEEYYLMAKKAKVSFNSKFWNDERNCLYDVVNENFDAALRPNQIFAVSLDYSLLDLNRSKKVVDVVETEFVTNRGLRTLSHSDPAFRGKYEGTRFNRDNAYHNGTVWPWLMGPFVSAYLRVNHFSASSRQYAFKNFIRPLFEEGIIEGGLGSISEIYDGSLPSQPRGCISQAWSIAEPLRAYVEEILQIKPILVNA